MKIILHHNLREPLPGILKLTQYCIYPCAHIREIKHKNYMGMPIDVNKSECIFVKSDIKNLSQPGQHTRASLILCLGNVGELSLVTWAPES